jgi:2-iminobutanoate/2-iminopropanoate deaminase
MAKRTVVHVPGMGGHRNPLPTVVTLGDLILPSVISGHAPPGQETASDPDGQIKQAFQNMKNIVEAAGGSVSGIGKITIYLNDFSHRDIVNKYWLEMFPDENERPARHVLKQDVQGTFIQMDVIASR